MEKFDFDIKAERELNLSIARYKDEIEREGEAAIFLAIKSEQPTVVAVFLNQLTSGMSAKVLKQFTQDLQTSIVLEMAHAKSVDQSVVVQTLKSVSETLNSGLKRSAHFGGAAKIAQILSQLPASDREIQLKHLEARDLNLFAQVSAALFTFETLEKFDAIDLQKILAGVAEKDLLLSLRGASEALKKKIYSAVSERRAENLREQVDSSAPQPLKDVQGAQSRIVAIAKRLQESNQIKDHLDTAPVV